MNSNLVDLGNEVERIYQCRAIHLDTRHVEVSPDGRTQWEGEVELFKLEGHPVARICYAWRHAKVEGGKKECIAILRVTPVDSAQSAVNAAFASGLMKQPENGPFAFIRKITQILFRIKKSTKVKF